MNSYPHKYFYHELIIRDTTASTSPTVGALVVDGGIGVQGNLSVGGQLQISGTWTSASTTPSTSTTSGALVLNGGIALNVTQDAVGISNGGALTIAGGVGIAKRVFVGDTIVGRNNLVIASGIDTIVGGALTLAYANRPGTSASTDSHTWSVSVASNNDLVIRNVDTNSFGTDVMRFSETNGTAQFKSKQSATLVSLQPNREDQLREQTFTSTTDVVSTPTNVTGLVFYTCRAFHCELVAFVDATLPLSGMFELRGIQMGDGTWQLAVDSILGDDVPVSFAINAGQITYTKLTTAGHVSTTFKWRVRTTYD